MIIKPVKSLILLILDGWGIAPKGPGNAIELARKPNFDRLWKRYPHTQLKAHGQFVGLPKDQVGNSEAGHMNIGAGRRVEQDSVLISESIRDGRFFKNRALVETMWRVRGYHSRLHLLGLISDNESPHSSLDHLYALVDMAVKEKISKVYLHLITDGRDSPQFSALKILEGVMRRVNGRAELATLMGRFFAMDRGKNWKRTQAAYDCLTIGRGDFREDYRDILIRAYNNKITDEYVAPAIIASKQLQAERSRFKNDDAVIFFNLRSDRARQLTKCFVQEKEFSQENSGAFQRSKIVKNLGFCAFTDFGPDLDDILTAFPSADIKYTLPLILKEYKQIYMAETEKYAHMTYFINGGYANPVNGEERLRIPSPRVKSYATKPEMSAYKITTELCRYLKSHKYDFLAANFANPDMVGHTGDLAATIKAIEVVDECLGKIVALALKQKTAIIITADHGNAEQELDLKTGEIWVGHTTNLVPFILIDDECRRVKLRSNGALDNIAPTIYDRFGIKPRFSEINPSLIIRK